MHKRTEQNKKSSFLFQIKPDRAFWYGFEQLEAGKEISFYDPILIDKNIRDIEWLRKISQNHPDSLWNYDNLFIIEKIDDTTFKRFKVSHFTEIE